MKTQPHREWKITQRVLQKMGACYNGQQIFKDLLPATLSTDPVDNLELVGRLCDHRPLVLLDWLAVRVCGNSLAPLLDGCTHWFRWTNYQGNGEPDPWVIAQYLAAIADWHFSSLCR